MPRPSTLAAVSLGLALIAVAAPAPAQEGSEAAAPATPPSATKPAPCTAPEHRGFDFWLGEWSVTNVATGASSARNRITAIQGGCAILEEYESGAYSGTSLNYYDAGDGRWHQSWIDNQGQPLRIHGGLEDGSMVLRSDPGGENGTTIQRITWTPREDGSVRQHWEASKDGGATWGTVFDGIYRRVE